MVQWKKEEAGFIDFIKMTMEKTAGIESHFHLAACGGCGCPSFMQPCSVCGHYPMGFNEAFDPRNQRGIDAFRRSVEATAGKNGVANIGTWYAASRRKTVAYKNDPRYSDAVEKAVEAFSNLGEDELPSVDEVWKKVVEDKVSLGGSMIEGHYVAWDVIRELDAAVHDLARGPSDGVMRLEAHFNIVKGELIAAMWNDGDDRDERLVKAFDLAGEAINMCFEADVARRNIRVGNLVSARSTVEKFIELKTQSPGMGM